ncbi:MAG: hypothetical protein EOP51_01265 [Sphingobacteriales bacterium]|nr:MAG: hypothetical protein EOP51_01265 [Sphingobacteriales bacterium]
MMQSSLPGEIPFIICGVTIGFYLMRMIVVALWRNAKERRLNNDIAIPEYILIAGENLPLPHVSAQDKPIPQYQQEMAGYVKQKYKYWTFASVHYGPELVEYYICWHGSENEWFADVIYLQKEYLLERNGDTFYFNADQYDPAGIPAELRIELPAIQEILRGYMVFETPLHPYWNYATLVRLQNLAAETNTNIAAINLLVFCCHFRSEWFDEYSHYYDRLIDDVLLNWRKYPFANHALFMFMTGWQLRTFPSLFHLPDAGVGKICMLRAHQLQPENPLYKWALSKELNLTREETKALAAQVTESEFDGLEPFIKDYFMQMVQGDAQL